MTVYSFNKGGQWDQIVNIILKYGIVPQSEFPNTKHSFDSKELNWLVKNKLRGFGIQLRKEMNSKKSLDQVRVIKAQMMNDIYRILVVSLGQPTTNFDWQFRYFTLIQ